MSELHCSILKQKGFKKVINVDFMKYESNELYSKILMNPPFSQNRAINHIEKAYSHHLKEDGLLIALMPSSDVKKLNLRSAHMTQEEIDHTLFSVSINISLVKIYKLSY